MKDYEVFRQWLGGVLDIIWGAPQINYAKKALDKEMAMMYTKQKPKRARGKKGKYLADDPTTKGVNEAWIGGKAPKKREK